MKNPSADITWHSVEDVYGNKIIHFLCPFLSFLHIINTVVA